MRQEKGTDAREWAAKQQTEGSRTQPSLEPGGWREEHQLEQPVTRRRGWVRVLSAILQCFQEPGSHVHTPSRHLGQWG